MATAQAEDGSFPTSFCVSLTLDGEQTSTTFRIISSFTPFTRGQVYLVESESHGEFPPTLILKVYDPKFTDDREGELYSPWTLATESLVSQKLEQGEISDDFNTMHLDDDVEVEPWHWEAKLIFDSENSFKSEIAAYKRLFEMQGKFIPKFYGCGRLLPTPPESRAIQPGAILIEYIPGVTLHDIDPTLVCPKLYRPLIEAVARFDCLGVLHCDLQTHNIMLAPPKAPERMVIIDFDRAVVRPEEMTDEEWGIANRGDLTDIKFSLETKLGIKLDDVDIILDDEIISDDEGNILDDENIISDDEGNILDDEAYDLYCLKNVGYTSVLFLSLVLFYLAFRRNAH